MLDNSSFPQQILLILILFCLIRADQYEKKEKLTEQQLISKLLDTTSNDSSAERYYDWRIRPNGGHNFGKGYNQGRDPVFVRVNMYLRTISKVDDVNMEYSLHFTFREEWVDERLEYKNSNLKYINLSPGQKIWMPDTFFQNEKEGKKHDIDTPNILLRVYVNEGGRILYSVRMTLTLSCPMDLQNYPMDSQECFIDLSSYAYTTKDISYFYKDKKPIQIKSGLRSSLPSFSLAGVRTANCTSVTNTGAYSCLRTILTLKRQFSYYLLQLYIPSLMLVAVSWVSFWLDKDSVPARVTLGVTTLLTMSTQSGGVNAKLPPVSYTKAIDVWIGVCLAFIFGALLEFALVNYFARDDSRSPIRHKPPPANRRIPTLPTVFRGRRNRRMDVECRCAYENINNSAISNDAGPYPVAGHLHDPPLMIPSSSAYVKRPSLFVRYWKGKYRSRHKRIDLCSRIIFPGAFFLFNAFYWVKYLRPYMAVEETVDDS